MQYRIYDRQTLLYKDGGYVARYTIDDDYIVNNNSTLSIVKKSPILERFCKVIEASGTYTLSSDYTIVYIEVVSGSAVVDFVGNKYAVNLKSGSCELYISYEIKDALSLVTPGDIVALIKDSGAFHKGVITTVDPAAYSISYKSDKELFNDNMLNAFRREFLEDDVKAAGRFGIGDIVSVLKALFVNTEDDYKRLPIKFVTEGDVLDKDGNPLMLWSWSNDSINIVDWLVELFTKYNVALSWEIDFNMAADTLDTDVRKPQYVCTVSAITNSGGIVKDNVVMQKITYTSRELPAATVCVVINSSDKEIINMSSGKNLLNPAAVEKNKYISYSNGYTVRVDSATSDISGYIRIRPDTQYTYSHSNGDTEERYIILYNAQKNIMGYMKYKPTTKSYSKTFGLDDFTIVGANNKKELGHWFKICFCNTAERQQLEKGDKATAYDAFDTPSVFYLYDKDGEYSVSTNKHEKNKYRVLPVKTVIATYNEAETDSDGVFPTDVAIEKLIPSRFNQAIEININADSKMFDFDTAKFGDLFKIINENGTVTSIYTGRKLSSSSKAVTLYFGVGRQNYTDIIQIRLRKDRYKEIYNLG